MLNKLYEQGKDLHVANYIVYANEGKLYEDADHKTEAAQEDCEKAFKLGRLMIDNSTELCQAVAKTSAGFVTYNGKTAVTYTPKA
mgnify:CR=1 FL=1